MEDYLAPVLSPPGSFSLPPEAACSAVVSSGLPFSILSFVYSPTFRWLVWFVSFLS